VIPDNRDKRMLTHTTDYSTHKTLSAEMSMVVLLSQIQEEEDTLEFGNIFPLPVFWWQRAVEV